MESTAGPFTLPQRPAPNFTVGGWAWVYNSASTIRQGVKANTDAKILKAKLALNWTGPYKVLAVGPCSAAETPGGSPLGSNLLYLNPTFNLTLAFDQNQAPTSCITPPPPHRIFDLQDSLDKLMHFLPQLSAFVPLRNGLYSFCAQTAQHHPVVDPDSYTVVASGVADLYP